FHWRGITSSVSVMSCPASPASSTRRSPDLLQKILLGDALGCSFGITRKKPGQKSDGLFAHTRNQFTCELFANFARHLFAEFTQHGSRQRLKALVRKLFVFHECRFHLLFGFIVHDIVEKFNESLNWQFDELL